MTQPGTISGETSSPRCLSPFCDCRLTSSGALILIPTIPTRRETSRGASRRGPATLTVAEAASGFSVAARGGEKSLAKRLPFLESFFDFVRPSCISKYRGTSQRSDSASHLSAEHTAAVTIMIRPIGPLRLNVAYMRRMRMPRSGPAAGALGDQLSALARRHLLRRQQEDLQAGLVDYQAIPPYPPRPRPPS